MGLSHDSHKNHVENLCERRLLPVGPPENVNKKKFIEDEIGYEWE
jgi:hypothetical protein